jgi:hypothetical protein
MALKTSSFFAGLILLGACSTGPVVKPEALAKVKSVAITGFEVVQQQPAELEFSIGGSNSQIDNMPMSKNPVAAKHATEIYEVMRNALAKNLGWSVSQRQNLVKDAKYLSITKEQISGWRSLPPVGAKFDVFATDGIMDYWAWEKLSATKRSELIKALNLDAAIVLRARSTLKESASLKKLYGGGNFHPQVALEFKVYDQSGKEIIWSNQRLVGQPTSEKAGHFAGISKRDALDKLVIKAAQNTAQKLTYK